MSNADLPKMEEIKDSVSVDTDRTTDGRGIGPEANRVDHLADGRRRNGLLLLDALLIIIILKLVERGVAHTADAFSNIDTSLGGVARLAWINGIVGSEDTIGAGPLSLRNGSTDGRIAVGAVRFGIGILTRGIARGGLNAAVEHVGSGINMVQGAPLALLALGRYG